MSNDIDYMELLVQRDHETKLIFSNSYRLDDKFSILYCLSNKHQLIAFKTLGPI